VIHSTAIISSKTTISEDVNIGPYCIVDEGVSIGRGTKLVSHVHIMGNTSIGENNIFFPFSSIGTMPQDLKYFGEDSVLTIGNNNKFREHVTVNTGTKNGGMITKIEDNCLFMVGSHVAHDCQISSNVIMANNATLAGHVEINQNAIIGGLSAVHQFVHIGKYAMIGGMSGVESNVIPYGLYIGIRGNLRGLNIIGLKRKNIESKTINNIQKIFKKIFNKSHSIDKNISELTVDEKSILEVKEIIDFINCNLKRGICRYIND
jgi:UDP-N-acetylglucosamine acyltransferase